MARYQWYHDTRLQPVFASEGYSLNTSNNGGPHAIHPISLLPYYPLLDTCLLPTAHYSLPHCYPTSHPAAQLRCAPLHPHLSALQEHLVSRYSLRSATK